MCLSFIVEMLVLEIVYESEGLEVVQASGMLENVCGKWQMLAMIGVRVVVFVSCWTST